MSQSLEGVWEDREEVVFPKMFGDVRRGIFPLPAQLFEKHNRGAHDPRWLTYGVFEYAPSAYRESWLYVTSGHSNPWETEPADYDPSGISGVGVEFMIETTEQTDWGIIALQNVLAFDILLRAGRYEGSYPLSFGDRVPIGKSAHSNIEHLFVVEPTSAPKQFSLASGKVNLVQLFGITEEECEIARSRGADELLSSLSGMSGFSVTNLRR